MNFWPPSEWTFEGALGRELGWGEDEGLAVVEFRSAVDNLPPETPADMLGARLGALLGGRVEGRLESHSDGEGGVSIESGTAMAMREERKGQETGGDGEMN